MPLLLLPAESVATPLVGWASVLAQAGGGGAGGSILSFLPILAMGVLAYFLFIVPQRTKDRKFQEMLAGLKENDRIVTTGGLHGVVTNVQRDQGRLTLRIDESSGTKIKVSLWAIDSVLTDDK